MSKRIKTSKVGIFYRESNSQSGKLVKTYYYSFTSKSGKKIEKKVGSATNGFNVGMAVEARTKAIQLDSLGSDSKFITDDTVVTMDDVAEIHFDIKGKKNSNNKKEVQRYNNHIGFMQKYHDIYFKEHEEALRTATTKGAIVVAKHRLKKMQEKPDASLLGAFSISDIGSAHIDRLIQQCDDRELSPKSKDSILSQLSGIFETALRKGFVSSNPVPIWRKDEDNINPKSEIDNESERFLSISEKEELYEAIEDESEAIQLFVHLALKTGARANSVCSIRKKDIKGNTITLADEKRKKLKDKRYTIPLHPKLLEMMKQRLDSIKPNDEVVELDYQDINNTMSKIYARLFNQDLNFRTDRKEWVSNHTLRHTFASELAINKTNIFTIMKLMHHADIKMTVRYAKLNEDENGSIDIAGLL